jgi:hypothetical protein
LQRRVDRREGGDGGQEQGDEGEGGEVNFHGKRGRGCGDDETGVRDYSDQMDANGRTWEAKCHAGKSTVTDS